LPVLIRVEIWSPYLAFHFYLPVKSWIEIFTNHPHTCFVHLAIQVLIAMFLEIFCHTANPAQQKSFDIILMPAGVYAFHLVIINDNIEINSKA
jgi:hypothetical protein